MFERAYFTEFTNSDWKYHRMSFNDVGPCVKDGYYTIDWITGESSFISWEIGASYFGKAF